MATSVVNVESIFLVNADVVLNVQCSAVHIKRWLCLFKIMISDVTSGIFCVIYPAVSNVLMIQADLIGHAVLPQQHSSCRYNVTSS